MAILRKGSVPERPKSVPYPPPFDQGIGPATRVSISDAGGITQFGVHVETLAAGARSTHRHWHSDQDEMVYVLAGELTVIDAQGRHEIGPGDAVTWPAGEANAHAMVNETDAPATYLVMGARGPQETVQYAEIDLRLTRAPGGSARFTRADGTPLEGS